MTTAKVWKLKKQFDGFPKQEDFALVEEKLPPLKKDEILIEALFLSLDPYFRLMATEGELPGEQVARIIDSKADGFPKGALVCAHVGWRSRTVINVKQPLGQGVKAEVIEEVSGLSPSLWLGAAGMPGVTAYIAFMEKCNPKAGEVVLVSAASGAVGSIVGQLAKRKGLTVIGLAGSKEKCDHLRSLGFDHALNYKEGNLSQALDKVAPKGIDIYYDNVGGEITSIAFTKLNLHGRVLVCGGIANYNKDTGHRAVDSTVQIMRQELTIQGFFIFNPHNIADFPRVRKQLVPLLKEGKLKAKEHITEGFKNMPKAFMELFTGANFGKAVLKV